MTVVRSVVRSVVQPVVRSVLGTTGPIPIFHMPMSNSLLVSKGIGPATFTAASTRTYIDKNDGLLKTAAINEARFEAEGQLIWGSVENLALFSEEFDNAVWTKSGGSTVTANQAISPDGTMNADLLDISAANSYITDNVNTLLGNDYIYAIFLRSVSGTGTWPLNWHDGTHHRELVNLTEAWQRFDISFNPAVNGTNIYLGDSRIGTNTLDTCYSWGVQVNEGGLAPYVKTEASPVTALSDNLSVDSDNIPAPGDDYSVSFELDYKTVSPGTVPFIYKVVGETTRRSLTDSSNRVKITHSVDTQSSLALGTTVSKLVGTKDSSTLTLYVDGALDDTAVPGAVTGTKSSIQLGRDGTTSSRYLNGHIKNIKIFDKTLTASEAGKL